MVVLLPVTSVNFSPIPTVVGSVECLWLELERPPPANLVRGTNVELITAPPGLPSRRSPLVLDEVVGTRVVLRQRGGAQLVPSATADGRWRSPAPHIRAPGAAAASDAPRHVLPLLGWKSSGTIVLAYEPAQRSVAGMWLDGAKLTGGYEHGSNFGSRFQLF